MQLLKIDCQDVRESRKVGNPGLSLHVYNIVYITLLANNKLRILHTCRSFHLFMYFSNVSFRHRIDFICAVQKLFPSWRFRIFYLIKFYDLHKVGRFQSVRGN